MNRSTFENKVFHRICCNHSTSLTDDDLITFLPMIVELDERKRKYAKRRNIKLKVQMSEMSVRKQMM